MKTNYMVLPLHAVRAAAGTGNEAPEILPSPIFVRNTPQSRKADYVVQISGDSMEPFYHDGDYVLVQKTSGIDDGEIGIFYYREGFIIKMQVDHKVVSANPNRPFVGKFEEMQLIGKVLGSATQDYTEDDQISLNELFAEEMRSTSSSSSLKRAMRVTLNCRKTRPTTRLTRSALQCHESFSLTASSKTSAD